MGFRENYKHYGYTTLFSLLTNNKNSFFSIYLLSDNLDFAFFKKLEDVFACKIIPISISADHIENVNCGYLSFGTLIRLLIGDYLPANVEKVLYLDADLIIDGDIHELLNYELGSQYAAVVRSSAPYKHLKDIRITSEQYFNAGVILFNMEMCRKDDIFIKSLDLLKRNNFKYLDQDALNIAMVNNVKYVDSKWNFDSFRAKTILLDRSYANKYPAIAIYHFTGRDKPWFKHCINQYQSIYLRYFAEILGYDVINNKNKFQYFKFKLIKFLFSNFVTRKIIYHLRNYIRTNIH